MFKYLNRKHDQRLNALLGLILGIGAPLGWLLIRFATTQRDFLFVWIRTEISANGAIYAYMGCGTIFVFVLFGYLLGRRSDVITEASKGVQVELEHTSALAMTDALTNIHNARYLHEHLSLEIESAKRHQMPLACMMIDIDDFKKINDSHGHPYGDTVLIKIASILRQCVRRIDIVGRLGGEEFLVVMPRTTSDVGLQVAERVRKTVQLYPFTVENKQVKITISIGVACYPALGITDKSGLLKAADEALYKAKRLGKNKTVMSSA
jgi:diguanylate cyclase (GGDEF)-like protein